MREGVERGGKEVGRGGGNISLPVWAPTGPRCLPEAWRPAWPRSPDSCQRRGGPSRLRVSYTMTGPLSPEESWLIVHRAQAALPVALLLEGGG